MAEILEYRILTHHNHKILEQEVNKLIGQGWVPQGGLAVGNNFYQAMVLPGKADTTSQGSPRS